MATNAQRSDISELSRTRYALLRSYRKSGEPVDTPMWFAAAGNSVLFRTKRGPKTARLRAHPQVELTACDYRGRKLSGATVFTGTAKILDDVDAAAANRVLHRRYGWQWNLVPLIRIPGVTQVHAGLPWREKWRKARNRNVWDDSVIVRVDFA